MAYNIKGIPCTNCILSRIEMSFNGFRFPIHLAVLKLKVGQGLSSSIYILLAIFGGLPPKFCLRIYKPKAMVLTLLSSEDASILGPLKIIFVFLV
jgi:hypothetical protein